MIPSRSQEQRRRDKVSRRLRMSAKRGRLATGASPRARCRSPTTPAIVPRAGVRLTGSRRCRPWPWPRARRRPGSGGSGGGLWPNLSARKRALVNRCLACGARWIATEYRWQKIVVLREDQ